ncbi:VCBS repeat-containing protein, partial [candidate division KSB1 bacterium]|nr:VCBS repeat-containing protein [candidate division KSB1 bacterium]
MRFIRFSLTAFFVTFLIYPSSPYAQLQQHERLLYSNPLLQNAEDHFAAAVSISGKYLSTGWQAGNNGRLVVRLKNRLPATGSIEFSMTNFNPRAQVNKGKQPIFTFTSRTYSDLAIFDEGVSTSFMYLRTGTNYFDGTDRCGLEFDTGYEGATTRDKDRVVLADKKWYADATYRFKFVWDHEYIWLLLDDQVIKKQLFKTPIERIRYISVGGDELYVTIVGPIYSDLKIYSAETDVVFSDRSFEKNLAGNVEKFGGHGVAVADVNLDGREDILVTSHVDGDCLRDLLYIQQAAGGYLEQSAAAGLAGDCGSFAAVFFDMDHDGDPDLFTTAKGGRNRLYVNDGTGFFMEEGVERGILAASTLSGGAIAVDVNRDGALDLFVTNIKAANELYLNDGNGRFTLTDRGAAGLGNNSGLRFPSLVTAADVDEDGDYDLYITKRQADNELFLNDGNGFFTEAAAVRGIALNDTTLHSAVFADYDNDGDMDLFCATGFASYTQGSLFVRVFSNDGSGFFDEYTSALQLANHGCSLQLFDANNDGFLDVYTQGNSEYDKQLRNRLWYFFQSSYGRLFLGSAAADFSDVGAMGADVSGYGARAVVAHDFDRDGDSDLFMTAGKFENVCLQNETVGTGNNWIQVSTQGPQGDKGGISTKMWVYAPGHLGETGYLLGYRQVTSQSGYATGNSVIQHFGLRGYTSCDIRLQRSDGSVIERRDLAVNRHHEILPGRLRLTLVSGHPQSGFVGERLEQPFVLQVADDQGTPLPDVAVEWRIVQGSGHFEGDTLKLSDSAGFSSIRFVCGDAPDTSIIKAHVALAEGSPVTFLVVSQLPPVSLSKMSGDDQRGIAGKTLTDMIVVRASYPDGRIAAGVSVTFRILAGGGNLAGDSTKIVMSDADGLAGVAWTLGIRAGQQVLRAETSESFVEFVALAAADEPQQMAAVSGRAIDSRPGVEFVEPFMVQLFDQYGNCVVDYPVTFSVDGGHLRGQAVRIVGTDSAGRAQVYWTPGDYHGVEQILTATATPVLSVQWRIPAVAVDAIRSGITAGSPLEADGLSRSNITVTLRDSAGGNVG